MREDVFLSPYFLMDRDYQESSEGEYNKNVKRERRGKVYFWILNRNPDAFLYVFRQCRLRNLYHIFLFRPLINEQE